MKKLIILALIVSTSIGVQAQDKHKIVFHLASGDSKEQQSLDRQLNNLHNYWPEAEIEVVIHGGAIAFMMNEKSVAKEAIIKSMENGVIFAVCQNTMRGKNVTEEEIIPGAVFVPNGIAEIVLKQEKGFSYIKAGY